MVVRSSQSIVAGKTKMELLLKDVKLICTAETERLIDAKEASVQMF